MLNCQSLTHETFQSVVFYIVSIGRLIVTIPRYIGTFYSFYHLILLEMAKMKPTINIPY